MIQSEKLQAFIEENKATDIYFARNYSSFDHFIHIDVLISLTNKKQMISKDDIKALKQYNTVDGFSLKDDANGRNEYIELEEFDDFIQMQKELA